MSDLSYLEKRKVEKLFGMGTGCVWNFSIRTFREFVMGSTDLDIEDECYQYGNGSKANRLRAFWQKEENDLSGITGELEEQCRGTVARLLKDAKMNGNEQINNFEYDVAISFAGEQRSEAQAVAKALDDAQIKVFFDEFEEAKLWGRNLYDYLSEVYYKKARYCLMLVSAEYATKMWPNHERQNAQARALTQKGEYILPVRFDQTEIPGLLPTIGYLEFKKHGADGICWLLQQKLGKPANAPRLAPAVSVAIAEPTEFLAQRKRVADTDILKQIYTGRRWRICIRPTEFKKARFQSLDHCQQFMHSSQVRIAGAAESYPYLPPKAARSNGDEWIAGESEFDGVHRVRGAERWVLFRSGLFIHHIGFDTVDRHKDGIHVLRILDIVTAALEFANRMAKQRVLQPEAVTSFEMHGVDGCRLTWRQGTLSDLDVVSDGCWCQDADFLAGRQMSAAELENNRRDIALDIALEIYSKFGWTSLSDDILAQLRDRQLGVS